ncbi:hypothetical protein LZK75_38980 (plasmid) [Rhizobium leguminosarum]|jgi:hypothetical protein|nr:hypothetical protein LZK75_38980 [Rhizobium leguminosarum]
MKGDVGHCSYPYWRTEALTAAVVRALPARRYIVPTGHAETHRKSVATGQYPASCSCEDAGYGYPANSQEVEDFVPVLLSRVVYTSIDNMIIPVLSSVNFRFYIDARKPPSTGMHWPVM